MIWSLPACPNAGRLLSQLTFSAALEHAVMADMLDKKVPARQAALRQLQRQADLWPAWLAGVTTRTGADATAAVRARLAKTD